MATIPFEFKKRVLELKGSKKQLTDSDGKTVEVKITSLQAIQMAAAEYNLEVQPSWSAYPPSVIDGWKKSVARGPREPRVAAPKAEKAAKTTSTKDDKVVGTDVAAVNASLSDKINASVAKAAAKADAKKAAATTAATAAA